MPGLRSTTIPQHPQSSQLLSPIWSMEGQPEPEVRVATMDNFQELNQCPHPGCCGVFKDLNAHLLTHQASRPFKCLVWSCEFHEKGFARKYDQIRHTLCHYRGTMTCGFCPSSGSAAEVSFDRLDALKRHLVSAHAVELTKKKRRRRPLLKEVNHKVIGPFTSCSICDGYFGTAQELYGHLDNCVLRAITQAALTEVINSMHLLSVADDHDVRQSLCRNELKTATGLPNVTSVLESQENASVPATGEKSKQQDDNEAPIPSNLQSYVHEAVQTDHPRTNKNMRKYYPKHWGMPQESLELKKRVLCLYEGQQRIWKDNMILYRQLEVRIPLPPTREYVTDLDVNTLETAQAVFNAHSNTRPVWNIPPTAVPRQTLPG